MSTARRALARSCGGRRRASSVGADAGAPCPTCIPRMDDDDPDVRAAAASSLRRLTNRFFGFDASAPAAGASPRDRALAGVVVGRRPRARPAGRRRRRGVARARAPAADRIPAVPGRFLYFSEVLLRLMPEQDYAVRLEALAEALPLEIAATDAEGRVVVWNAALAVVAGPRAQALGRPLLEAVPWLREDPNVDWRATVEDVLSGGPPRTFPRHPLGRRVVRATVAPMIGARGLVLGRRAVLRGHHARHARGGASTPRGAERGGHGVGRRHRARDPQPAERALPQPPAPARAARGPRRQPRRPAAQGRRDDRRGGAHGVAHPEPAGGESRRRARVRGRAHRRHHRRRREAPAAGGPGARASRSTLPPASRRVLPLERTRIERAFQNLLGNAIDAAGRGRARLARVAGRPAQHGGRRRGRRPGHPPRGAGARVRAVLDGQARRHGAGSAAGASGDREPRRRARGARSAGRGHAGRRAPADPRGPGRTRDREARWHAS